MDEIVHRLEEIRGPLILKILKEILKGYNDLISERLGKTKIYPSKAGNGLGLGNTSPRVALKIDSVVDVRFVREVIVNIHVRYPLYLAILTCPLRL